MHHFPCAHKIEAYRNPYPHTYIDYKDRIITDRSNRPGLPKPLNKQSIVSWRCHHTTQLHDSVSHWLKVVRSMPPSSLPWWVVLLF